MEAPARLVPSDQTDAALMQAEADLQARRPDKALTGFTAVLKATPANARAKVGLAETHLALGDGEAALRTIDMWPADLAAMPVAQQARGIAHLLRGNDALAEQHLTAAVTANPALWRSWNALGLVNDRKRAWAEADRCYQRARDGNPQAAEVHNNHGYSLVLRGNIAAAVPRFEQALRLDPSLSAARNNLTVAAAMQGRYESALASVATDGEPVALNNVGFAALVRGDYQTAETYLSRAVQTSPRHFPQATENLKWLSYLRTQGREPFKTARNERQSPQP